MTEDAWLSAGDPQLMLSFIFNSGHFRSRTLERKCRLYALECALSVVQHLRDARSRDAVDFMNRNCDRNFRRLRHRGELQRAAGEVAYEAADRREGAGELREYWNRRVRADAAHAAYILLDPRWSQAALECGLAAVEVAFGAAVMAHWPADTLVQRERVDSTRNERVRANGMLLRDLFGNPFRPVAFDPSWRTDTAVSLARGMYESRDFSPMPILADALQDAGCADESVLSHCRGDGPHVRGCWVVDLVLGKE